MGVGGLSGLVALLVASLWDLGVVMGVWIWVGREGRPRVAGPRPQPHHGSGPLRAGVCAVLQLVETGG